MAEDDGARHGRLVAALVAWGEQHLRDLPWRRTRDPWAVLVAEAMLQQTQVVRVVERWPVFLDRFPDPASTAAAPLGDVLAAWSGLGYYRRARDLHRTAVAVVERHDGTLPADLDALLALPGIGPDTARAVLAFAFERQHGIVDANASRLLARAVTGERLTPTRAQRLADALVPDGAAWAWNQTVLDLGATVCVARAPRCGACPITASCAWYARGLDEPDPARGSAGASTRQATFAGSDRQGRGRLLAALVERAVAIAALAAATGWDDDPVRARRVADDLVTEGLAVLDGAHLRLPS